MTKMNHGVWMLGPALLAGVLGGCAPVRPGPAGGGPGTGEVVVRCTLDAASATPCQAAAAHACAGTGAPRLRAIRSQGKLPVTEGADQHAAPLYQYEAAYACSAGGRP